MSQIEYAFLSNYAASLQLNPLEVLTRPSTGSRFNRLGRPVLDAVDQARYDFDALTLDSRGVLIEPPSTNLFPESQGVGGWRSLGTTPPAFNNNNTFAGETCASVTFTSASAPGWTGSRIERSGFGQGVTTLDQTYFSHSRIALSRPLVGSETIMVRVTGQMGLTAVTLNASNSQDCVGKFVKFKSNRSGVVTVAGGAYFGIDVAGGVGSDLTVYMNHLQLEAGRQTSYIPTLAAPVSRSADVLSVNGSNFNKIWRPEQGTIVVRARLNNIDNASQGLLAATDASLTNRFGLGLSTSGNFLAYCVRNNTTFAQSVLIGVTPTNREIKAAMSHNNGRYRMAIDGVSAELLASSAPLGVSQLSIGHLVNQYQWNGTVGMVGVIARETSLAELAELTKP